MNIEQLKEMATFSEEKINQAIDNALGSYEDSKQFVFMNPSEMLEQLKTLFSQGWTTGSRYTHVVHMPSYFGMWLVKPLHIQGSEKLQIASEVKAKYLAEVEHYKSEYIRLKAEQTIQAEKEKALKSQENKESKRPEELTNQFAKEFN